MTINRATFAANINAAVSRRETVMIGGGHFDSNDMRDLLAIVEATPAAIIGEMFAGSFPAKPVEPETELGAYTTVRVAWRNVAEALQAGSLNTESLVGRLAVAVQCVHADALSIRRINASLTQSLANADAAAVKLNDQVAEAEGRLDQCALVAKFRDGGEPVAFLRCHDDTWKEIDRAAPYDARARIMACETVCNDTARFRLATGAELYSNISRLIDRAEELGELHTSAEAAVTEWRAEARHADATAKACQTRAEQAEARELATFAAIKPVMAELGGLTLSMLPPGAYGGALADAYTTCRKELAL